MKTLLILLLMACVQPSYGQTQSTNQTFSDTRLFAQCMFDISDQAEMEALQNEMYNNPYIEMVRLDAHTQRALIITANLEKLTTEEFKSWFGSYESTITCVQIGVYGVDIMNVFPFTNCQ